MKYSSMIAGLLAVVALCAAALPALAQGQPRAVDALDAAGQQGKFSFVFFWRQQNAASDAMAASLEAQLAGWEDSTTTVHVLATDRNQQAIVNRFGVSRAPMPLVLAVAPNGAVTGAYRSPLTAENVANAIVSPSTAACMKAMQDGQIVILHVQQGDTQAPQGVQQFLADDHYAERSVLVPVAAQDAAEAELLAELGVTDADASGCVVMMAPPGVLVGKFPIDVSFNQLASELHEAGKCCDDPNCPHNH